MKLLHSININFLGLVSKDNDLPSITASLFQSPGGRKFLEFMNPFIRFVAIKYLKTNETKRRTDTIFELNLNNIKKMVSEVNKVLSMIILIEFES